MKAKLIVLVLFIAVPAHAKQIKTVTIALDGTCNVIQLTINKNKIAALENDACATLKGVGEILKVKLPGGALTQMAIVGGAQDPSPASYPWITDFESPFVTGGHWTRIYSKDGQTVHDGGSGTYTVLDGSDPGP